MWIKFLKFDFLDFLGFAGILNWTVAIGPDTLKSRFQTGMLFYESIFLMQSAVSRSNWFKVTK